MKIGTECTRKLRLGRITNPRFIGFSRFFSTRS
jgi:hypothetical protein